MKLAPGGDSEETTRRRAEVTRERLAVFAVFGLNGALCGSWTPRVPALADQVRAGAGPIGLALLSMTIGMLLVGPFAGRLAERHGCRAVMAGAMLLSCVLLPLLGLAGSVTWLGVVLFGLGASIGATEVAMNIGGVLVERRLGKPVMTTLHAGFSLGGLVASASAAFAAAHDLSPVHHFTIVAIVVSAVFALVMNGLPRGAVHEEKPVGGAPIKRPVLWLLGSVALLSAVAEGGSSDWSALLLVTEHGVDQGTAALGFAGFSLAMAVTRLVGAWIQRRFGAARTLVVGALLAGGGLVVAAVVPVVGLAFLGFMVAGAGLAGAFPTAQSMAGAAGQRADGSGGEREVAFVATVAYSGFLIGPPMIGGIAQTTSLSVSFVVVGVLAALISFAVLGAVYARARELRDTASVPKVG